MSSPAIIRVFLVDDHQLVRAAVRQLLQDSEDIEVVGEAGSGEEACRLASRLDPHVIVMDVSLPGISGIETIGRLLRILPDTRILVVTMHESDPFLRLALERGASGYLSKRSAPEELATAVRAIAAGGNYLESGLVERQLSAAPLAARMSGLEALAPREFEIFTLLARGRKATAIAEALHLSPKTIHYHRANLMRKLAVETDVELARMAARLGVIDPFSESGA